MGEKRRGVPEKQILKFLLAIRTAVWHNIRRFRFEGIGRLAQLVRALPSHGRGHWSESSSAHHSRYIRSPQVSRTFRFFTAFPASSRLKPEVLPVLRDRSCKVVFLGGGTYKSTNNLLLSQTEEPFGTSCSKWLIV